ncbi:hypothetical protein T265_04604 [Opisthorchis viverrini]|uniref:Uncharacterized protein n=1 Tax=Opisthorchis viverrini TaxID=6198 RepID=A0A074ZZ01_OPIVI|nr:hypothetical protein T265_04604 [Opisthorchis viverrini]KER28555.1 hypothetical protein T265_04604 [Opisthorchis viverrini]
MSGELMDASDQIYEFFKPLKESDVALRKSFHKRLLTAAVCFGIVSVVFLILGVSLMGVYGSKRYSDVTSTGLFAFGCTAFVFCLPTFAVAGLLIKALVVTKSANDEARRRRQFRVDELLTVDYPKMPSRVLTPPPEYEPTGAANERTVRVVISRSDAESDGERECVMWICERCARHMLNCNVYSTLMLPLITVSHGTNMVLPRDLACYKPCTMSTLVLAVTVSVTGRWECGTYNRALGVKAYSVCSGIGFLPIEGDSFDARAPLTVRLGDFRQCL